MAVGPSGASRISKAATPTGSKQSRGSSGGPSRSMPGNGARGAKGAAAVGKSALRGVKQR